LHFDNHFYGNQKGGKILQNNNNEKNLLKQDEFAEYLMNKGLILDVNDFKKELEKYMEKENVKTETDVDRWINVLNGLIDWANEG
jgi:hypothetical protein